MGLIIGAVILLVAGIAVSMYILFADIRFPEIGDGAVSLYSGALEEVNLYYPEVLPEYNYGRARIRRGNVAVSGNEPTAAETVLTQAGGEHAAVGFEMSITVSSEADSEFESTYKLTPTV